MRQHASAYVSIRQHTSAYGIIRTHTLAYVSMRQHASSYVRIRTHTSAYVSIRQRHLRAIQSAVLHNFSYMFFFKIALFQKGPGVGEVERGGQSACECVVHEHTSAYVSIRRKRRAERLRVCGAGGAGVSICTFVLVKQVN
jgi:hypothetical protein